MLPHVVNSWLRGAGTESQGHFRIWKSVSGHNQACLLPSPQADRTGRCDGLELGNSQTRLSSAGLLSGAREDMTSAKFFSKWWWCGRTKAKWVYSWVHEGQNCFWGQCLGISHLVGAWLLKTPSSVLDYTRVLQSPAWSSKLSQRSFCLWMAVKLLLLMGHLSVIPSIPSFCWCLPIF